jgi:cold shock CspA family protein
VSERIEGIVSYWNPDRGFGFARSDGEMGGDAFLHISSLPHGQEIGEGDSISFELAPNPRRPGGYMAVKIIVLSRSSGHRLIHSD